MNNTRVLDVEHLNRMQPLLINIFQLHLCFAFSFYDMLKYLLIFFNGSFCVKSDGVLDGAHSVRLGNMYKDCIHMHIDTQYPQTVNMNRCQTFSAALGYLESLECLG